MYGATRGVVLSSTTKTKEKTLAHHIFRVGSVKNASEFVTNSKFIINYIQKEYHEGYDIAQALRESKHTDLETNRPVMQHSVKEDKNEK